MGVLFKNVNDGANLLEVVMGMDARCESQCSVCEDCDSNSDDFRLLDGYSVEQLEQRMGQARMRIEDEQLIFEACRQILQQSGVLYEYDA